MTTVQAWVFDAFGTLFDVHSAVRRNAASVGAQAGALSQLWRTKQLEYTWVRSLMHRHADFEAITSSALDFALAQFRLTDPALRANLLDAYRTLEPYPEVATTLRALKDAGMRTAILSNGTPAMLQSIVAAAQLEPLFDAVLSIEEVGIYKPDPRVYQLAVDRLGVAPEAASFQSSNAWDIAGAHAFGFRVVWINRTAQPREYELPTSVPELSSLASLPSLAG